LVIERHAADDTEQNLCLDKGYAGQPTQDVATERGDQLHVPDKANAKQKRRRKSGRRKAHRWVVEVTYSLLKSFSTRTRPLGKEAR
jgi:hypothetical protein